MSENKKTKEEAMAEMAKNMGLVPQKMFKLDTSKVTDWETLQLVLEGLNLCMSEDQYNNAPNDELKKLFVEMEEVELPDMPDDLVV